MKAIISLEPLIATGTIKDARGGYHDTASRGETRTRVLFAQLMGLGFKTFLCPHQHQLIELLGRSNYAGNLELYPLILNAAEYSKGIQDYGAAGFARRQLANVKIPALPQIAFFGVRHLPQVLMRDFRYVSLLLAYFEMAEFNIFHPRVVFLHPQMTDLALANGNEGFFRLFASFISSKKAQAGLVTNNIGVLIDRLDKWDIDITYIAGPINRTGYHMKPDQRRCEELIAGTRRMIIATEVNSAPVPVEEDLSYLRELNVSSFVAKPGSALDALKIMDMLQK